MKLREFVGNQNLRELLTRSLLPPASIFAGPSGVGKQSLALALAAFTNCRRPESGDLCGTCGSCIKAASGNHPDIILYPAEKNVIKIESMRELSREAQFRPFEGRKRIFVIDQAECLTEEAANSILKTLEEPPDSSRVVLVTAFPLRLLETIRSRCQIFHFAALKRADIADYLKGTAQVDDVELRASLADGSIGKALSLDLKKLLPDRDRMLAVLSAWSASRSFEAIYTRAEESPMKGDLRSRDRVREYLELLQMINEDLYFLLTDTPERLVNIDRKSELNKLSQNMTLDSVQRLLYDIAHAIRDIDRYVNPLMTFETLWLRTAAGR